MQETNKKCRRHIQSTKDRHRHSAQEKDTDKANSTDTDKVHKTKTPTKTSVHLNVLYTFSGQSAQDIETKKHTGHRQRQSTQDIETKCTGLRDRQSAQDIDTDKAHRTLTRTKQTGH
ncbi:hypothetical protein ACJMK2_016073 [Sinanodonta woodiana]|uniref:Uncharacterized protein n=1 Tax=Sinanodonta woodiana TaxID=1069815 RepID=A0ABD3USH0_SINWO